MNAETPNQMPLMPLSAIGERYNLSVGEMGSLAKLNIIPIEVISNRRVVPTEYVERVFGAAEQWLASAIVPSPGQTFTGLDAWDAAKRRQGLPPDATIVWYLRYRPFIKRLRKMHGLPPPSHPLVDGQRRALWYDWALIEANTVG